MAPIEGSDVLGGPVKRKIPGALFDSVMLVDLMTTRFPRGRRRRSTGAGVCLRAWGDLVQTYDQERPAGAEGLEASTPTPSERSGEADVSTCRATCWQLRDAARASRPSASLAA
jgi:hypothetical protein